MICNDWVNIRKESSIYCAQLVCLVCFALKIFNVKVFNLMSSTYETGFIEWHETCKCECKFGANVCNNK